MYLKQHTLSRPVRLEGVGLHTGASCAVTFHPAAEGHGYVFRRADLPNSPLIPADVDYVTDLQRSTTIAIGDAAIQTVEHALASLAGLQLDNILIEVEGPELPILDGSARVYVEELKKAGSIQQNANREFYVIDEPLHYHDAAKNIDLAALQFEDYRLSVMVEYNSEVLGIQHASLIKIEDFEKEVAPSRTFCFLHELEYLIKENLIKGGNLDNAMVIVDQELPREKIEQLAQRFNIPTDIRVEKGGVLSEKGMYFPNEPARHKLLDLIGDLTLIGAPLKAQIVAIRPGHASNITFARQIKSVIKQKKIIKKYQKAETPGLVFDIHAIQKILPHRYPFLLVDRITNFTENSIEGYKNVTINEPFFVGHFDGNPIMPGVLQLEAMAQVGGILLLNIIENPADHWVYFLAIDKARFKKPVIPGDQLHFKLELLNLKRNICKMFGRAFVDGQLVCEAELVASLVKKN